MKASMFVVIALVLCTCSGAQSVTQGQLIGLISFTKNAQPSSDTGTITITANSVSKSAHYGVFSTNASVASVIGAYFSQDCNSPVTALAAGDTVSFFARTSSSTGITLSSSSSADQGSSPTFVPISGTIKTPTTTHVSSATTQVPQGNPLTLTATVDHANATGSITFLDSGESLGVVPLSEGSAQLVAANLGLGNHQISTAYSGDDTYAASVSSSLSVIVSQTLQGVHYSYDELGRLVGVADQSGAAAQYGYDANGNIVSIARFASGQTSVLAFSPSEGEAGTIVTISGTNFAPSPSQNQITFNGTSASAITATPNVLTVAVPSGATSGLISVTSPAGSASSAKPFRISGHGGRPIITSFTPVIADRGSSISVVGENFYPMPSGNVTTVGRVRGPVASVKSSQSLSMTIPGRFGSGHVDILTAQGTGESDADLFVPPAPYTSAQVVVAQRVSTGVNIPVEITHAGGVGMLITESPGAQKLDVLMSNSTYGGECGTVKISVVRPSGVLGLAGTPCMPGGYLGTMVAAEAGTYAFVIDPQGQGGSANFSLNFFSDVTGQLNVNSSLPISITYPGQSAHYTFNGTAGQQVSLGVSGANFNGCYSLSLQGPGGSQVASTGSCGTTASLPSIKLPYTGTYTANVTLSLPSSTGAANISLSADLYGSIALNSTVPVAIAFAGQSAHYVFMGSAGQRVNVGTSGVNYGCFTLNLGAPGAEVGTTYACGDARLSNMNLPVSGSYTIDLTPQGGTGSTNLSLSSDLYGTIALNSSLQVNLPFAGQSAHYTFSGSAGQGVNLGTGWTALGCFSLDMTAPDGSGVTTTYSCGNAQLPGLILPTTGTYTIDLTPNGGTGSIALSLSTDIYGAIALNSSLQATVSYPGQSGHYTFSGSAGQRVNLGTGWTALGCFSLDMTAPDGSSVTTTYSCGNAQLPGLILPTTGTYTINLTPNGGTGSIALSLSTDIYGAIALNSSLQATVSYPGQSAHYTFSGSAGQRVNLGTGWTALGCFSLDMTAPDGSGVTSTYSCGDAELSALSLPTTGTYTINLTPNGGTGSIALSLSSDVYGTIDTHTPISVSILFYAQAAHYTFSGTAGQSINVLTNSTNFGCVSLDLANPDNSGVGTTYSCGDPQLSGLILPLTGTYTIDVTPRDGIGSTNLSLTTP